MFGKPKIATGTAATVLSYYLVFGLLTGLLLVGAATAACVEPNVYAKYTPWLVLAALTALGLGGWTIFRRLRTLATVETQLSRAAANFAVADFQSVPVRNSATLGWNRLVQQLQSETAALSLAERLEVALASHAGSDLEDALQSISDGLAVTDAQGRITFANRALAALLADGCDEQDLREASIFEILTANTSTCDTSLLDTGAMHAVVGELSARADNKNRYMRAARHPLLGSDSQAGHVWSIRDVTQQRLANQMRDQFLDSATHELRTPLANIKAYAETLALDDMIDVECQKDFCNTINAEATRLARLIDDLLDLSSMEVGSLSLAKQNVELERLLREVVEKVTPLMEKKQLTFEVSLPEKLPEMQLDKDKIATTLVNLLGNAAKYTESGGRVALRVKASPSEIQVDIEDSGVGIAETDLPHVFEKFFRGADHRVQSETGTGLGLSIAREIVRLHGGDIEVQSQLNQGSTFSLTLPRGKGA